MFKKILVATDFTQPSKRALETAMTVCDPNGGEITVLHVIDARIFRSLRDLSIPEVNVIQRESQKQAQQQLETFVSQAKPVGKVKIQGHMATAIPFIGITDEAQKLEADLIVVGTPGKSGFQEMISGSLTQKVVKMSRCPVLVVK